jgi:hypothetical protein
MGLFSSCSKKENKFIQKDENPNQTGLSRQISTKSMEELILNSGDKQAEDFVKQQLRIGYGLFKLLKTTTAKSEIVGLAQSSNDDGISLKGFLNNYAGYKSTVEQEIASLDEGVGVGQTYDEIESYLNYNEVHYWFTLKTINCHTADLTRGFFLAVGQEIETDDDRLQNHIPAWHYTEDGETEIVLLSESDLSNESEPVIIISEINESAITGGFVDNTGIYLIYHTQSDPVNNPPPTIQSDAMLYHTSASINYRYENDKHSEYFAMSMFTEWPESYGSGPLEQPDNDNSAECKKISKHDLGVTQTFSVYAYNPNNYNYFHFITYEYDKHTSLKTVTQTGGESGSDGMTFYIQSKFNTEWYQLDANQYVLPYGWPNLGYIRTYHTSLGINDVTRN